MVVICHTPLEVIDENEHSHKTNNYKLLFIASYMQNLYVESTWLCFQTKDAVFILSFCYRIISYN